MEIKDGYAMFFDELLQHIDKSITVQYVSHLLIQYSTLVIGSIVIMFLGFIIAKFLGSLVTNICTRTSLAEVAAHFIGNLTYIVVIAVAGIASLNNLGVHTTSLAAILGAFSVAIGLAFQNSLSNFSAGILILILKPFKKGDYVECAGMSGTVKSIDTLIVELLTFDNKIIIVPNSKVIAEIIVNHSAETNRRVDLIYHISYNEDIEMVKKILLKLIKEEEDFLDNPEPQINVTNLTDTHITITVKPWTKAKKYWDVYNEFNEKILDVFKKAEILLVDPNKK